MKNKNDAGAILEILSVCVVKFEVENFEHLSSNTSRVTLQRRGAHTQSKLAWALFMCFPKNRNKSEQGRIFLISRQNGQIFTNQVSICIKIKFWRGSI